MSTQEANSNRRLPFPVLNATSRIFFERVTQLVGEMVAERVNPMISDRNTLHFFHGCNFSTTTGSGPEEFQELCLLVPFPVEALKENKTSVLVRITTELAEKFAEGQKKRLFEVVDKVGNTISATTERPLIESFVEMAKSIDYFVGEDGRINTPSLFLNPQVANRILPELKAQESQYVGEFEKIHNQKTVEAYAREKVRISKFRNE
jgi:hypothetical protein